MREGRAPEKQRGQEQRALREREAAAAAERHLVVEWVRGYGGTLTDAGSIPAESFAPLTSGHDVIETLVLIVGSLGGIR